MKCFLFLFIVLSSKLSFSQPFPNYGTVNLEKASDYRTADPVALQAANYLLSTPFEKNNQDRSNSLKFMAKWMKGTPDYGFAIDRSIGKIFSGDNDMLGLLMAAMVKYTLENTATSKDINAVKLNAVSILLTYCENPENKIRMSRPLKKLSEAKANGQLAQALNK